MFPATVARVQDGPRQDQNFGVPQFHDSRVHGSRDPCGSPKIPKFKVSRVAKLWGSQCAGFQRSRFQAPRFQTCKRPGFQDSQQGSKAPRSRVSGLQGSTVVPQWFHRGFHTGFHSGFHRGFHRGFQGSIARFQDLRVSEF